MKSLFAMNLALKFVVEMAALALLGLWGVTVGDGVWGYVLAVAAPAAVIIVWARCAAPRAPARLPTAARMLLELGLFALSAVAGYAAGARAVALAFGVIAVANAAGLALLQRRADDRS